MEPQKYRTWGGLDQDDLAAAHEEDDALGITLPSVEPNRKYATDDYLSDAHMYKQGELFGDVYSSIGSLGPKSNTNLNRGSRFSFGHEIQDSELNSNGQDFQQRRLSSFLDTPQYRNGLGRDWQDVPVPPGFKARPLHQTLNFVPFRSGEEDINIKSRRLSKHDVSAEAHEGPTKYLPDGSALRGGSVNPNTLIEADKRNESRQSSKTSGSFESGIQVPVPSFHYGNSSMSDYAGAKMTEDVWQSQSKPSRENSGAVAFSVQAFKTTKSRSVLVFNLPKQLSTNDLISLFSTFGDVEYIFTGRKSDLGVIVVSYFDLNDAVVAVNKLSMDAFPVDVQYCVNIVPPSIASSVGNEIEDIVHQQDIYFDDHKLCLLKCSSSAEAVQTCKRYGQILTTTKSDDGFIVAFSNTRSCATAFDNLKKGSEEIVAIPVPLDAAELRLGRSLYNFINGAERISGNSLNAYSGGHERNQESRSLDVNNLARGYSNSNTTISSQPYSVHSLPYNLYRRPSSGSFDSDNTYNTFNSQHSDHAQNFKIPNRGFSEPRMGQQSSGYDSTMYLGGGTTFGMALPSTGYAYPNANNFHNGSVFLANETQYRSNKKVVPTGSHPHHLNLQKGMQVNGGPPAALSANRGNNQTPFEFLVDVDNISQGLDTRTSIMIRNIPNKYTQNMLLEEIDVRFRGLYDFFYLPIDFKNKCNVGYAFLNVTDSLTIIDVYHEFNNKIWSRFNSDKVCVISYAKIQGKMNLINRFRNSSLMAKECEYRPLIFYSEGPLKGMPEPFPAPSR